jgi:TatD DNase family protein
MMLIDTHTHLTTNAFGQDLDDVIQRAKDADVMKMITVGTDLESSRNSIVIAERYPEIYAAVGIHPHEAGIGIQALTRIQNLADHPKVVAIGEIGLDYYYDLSPRDQQHTWFKSQLELARKLNLPVIIHVREAMDDALSIIQSAGTSPWRGVFHCYGGTRKQIPDILNMGFYISFTGVVTFKNFKHADAVQAVPLNRLLLETDAPYMTPVPHRGKRNESMYLPYTVQALAKIMGVPPLNLIESSTQNADSLFKLAS